MLLMISSNRPRRGPPSRGFPRPSYPFVPSYASRASLPPLAHLSAPPALMAQISMTLRQECRGVWAAAALSALHPLSPFPAASSYGRETKPQRPSILNRPGSDRQVTPSANDGVLLNRTTTTLPGHDADRAGDGSPPEPLDHDLGLGAGDGAPLQPSRLLGLGKDPCGAGEGELLNPTDLLGLGTDPRGAGDGALLDPTDLLGFGADSRGAGDGAPLEPSDHDVGLGRGPRGAGNGAPLGPTDHEPGLDKDPRSALDDAPLEPSDHYSGLGKDPRSAFDNAPLEPFDHELGLGKDPYTAGRGAPLEPSNQGLRPSTPPTTENPNGYTFSTSLPLPFSSLLPYSPHSLARACSCATSVSSHSSPTQHIHINDYYCHYNYNYKNMCG